MRFLFFLHNSEYCPCATRFCLVVSPRDHPKVDSGEPARDSDRFPCAHLSASHSFLLTPNSWECISMAFSPIDPNQNMQEHPEISQLCSCLLSMHLQPLPSLQLSRSVYLFRYSNKERSINCKPGNYIIGMVGNQGNQPHRRLLDPA